MIFRNSVYFCGVTIIVTKLNKFFMEVKRIERGNYKGRIDMMRSLDTMAIGEAWCLKESTVNLRTARNCCSRATNAGGKVFSCQCPGLTENFITIRRIR